MSDQSRDTLAEWELCVACLAEEIKAGRKLSPKEMLDRVAAVRKKREAAE